MMSPSGLRIGWTGLRRRLLERELEQRRQRDLECDRALRACGAGSSAQSRTPGAARGDALPSTSWLPTTPTVSVVPDSVTT